MKGSASLFAAGLLAWTLPVAVEAVEVLTQEGVPLNQSFTDDLNGIVGVLSDPLHSTSSGGSWNAGAFTNATSSSASPPVPNVFWHPDNVRYHITWDLGANLDEDPHQLDTVSIWIHAEDPGRHSFHGSLSVSLDGVEFTEIPGTLYHDPLAQAGSVWQPVMNNVTYAFEPGEVTGFRYLRLNSYDDTANGRLQPRYVEVDAWVSRVPRRSSRPQFWSMREGRFYVDDQWVFLKNGKLLRHFGNASHADTIIDEIDVMIDQLDYNNISFNIYPDQFDTVGDGRVDPARRAALAAFARILDHCWKRGIFYSLSFETYNVGGGGVPARLFQAYPEIQARNALLEEARDIEYGGANGRRIPSIHHPRYLKWSRDFLRNFLLDLGDERASRALYVETTVEPQYLGRNEVDDDQRRAALDYSETAREAFGRWQASFPPGDRRRTDFSWPETQAQRDASIGNAIFNEFRGEALGRWVSGDIAAIRSVAPDVYVAVDYNARFDDPNHLRVGNRDRFLTSIEGADIIQIAPHWDAVWTSMSWNDVITVNDRENKGWAISEHMTANGGFPQEDAVMASILDNTLARGTRWGWDFVNVANNHPTDLFHLYHPDWTSPVLNIIEGENWDSWLAKIGATRFERWPRVMASYYDRWREEVFSPAERVQEEIAGPAADPGGAGVTNLMRYALGLDPRSPDRAALPRGELNLFDGVQYLVLTYTRNRMARDVEIKVEASSDLAEWAALPGEQVIARALEGELEQIRVRDFSPVDGGAPRRFIRLRAELREGE